MPNQVTLTFAGDEKALTDSFGRVGGSAKKMGDDVGAAARGLDEHANGMSKVGEAADNSERNLIGVHDVIDGTATIMQGPGKQGIVAYIQGWADLAGGLAPLIMTLAETKFATIGQTVAQKAAAVGTKAWAAAQWIMNSALLASPITWIVVGIVALIAVIVLIATKTTWFQTAWRLAWGGIKAAASNVWDWLKALPGKIGNAFGRIGSTISAPFKAAFNLIASAWNNTVGRLSFTVPGWVPGLGGKGWSAPQLPHFHAGGVVPGVKGSPQVALLQGGEKISQSGGGGGGTTVFINDGLFRELIVQAVAAAVGQRGGDPATLNIRLA
jgi:hypothetical protein